jgi:DNA-binding IclR family transcriptional regulator
VPALESRLGPLVNDVGQTQLDPLVDDDGSPDRTVLGRLDAILASFDGSDRVLALSEISRRVGLPKSTVHRLADQLCAVGWLERNSGGYRVGLKLLELGGIALQRNGLREVAFRHIYALALKTGLAVQLGILDHGEVVYLERIVLTRFGLPTRVGGRQPAYCTALGKAMLAFEDETSQDSVLANMPRRTEFTITDPRALKAEFESVCRTGVAYDREEAYKGLVCVASPIRSSGRAIGAISVTGPIGRMQAHSVVQDVRNAALSVWGGRPPAAPSKGSFGATRATRVEG